MSENKELEQFNDIDKVSLLGHLGLKIGDRGTFKSEMGDSILWRVVDLLETIPGHFEVVFEYKERRVYKAIPVSEISDFQVFQNSDEAVRTLNLHLNIEANFVVQPEIVKKVFQLGFKPDNLILTLQDGFKFYFANPVQFKQKMLISFLFCFNPYNKVYYPVFAYRSTSDGGWRFSPGSENGGIFSKGRNIIKNFSYVASTRPAPEIEHHLNSKYIQPLSTLNSDLEDDFKTLIYQFYLNNMLQNPSKIGLVSHFEIDRSILRFTEFTSSVLASERVPYHVLKPSNIACEFLRESPLMTEMLERGFGKMPQSIEEAIEMQVSDFEAGFVPDFNTRPINSGQSYHTVFGVYNFEQYLSYLAGRPITWTMAYDQKGRVWIDSIVFNDSKITPVGIQEETINASLYNLKPIDYSSYLTPEAAQKAQYVDYSYSDITPIIDLIPAVQQFRKARSIYRTS